MEPTQGKKFEHNGIKIELLGQIGVLPLLQDFRFRFLISWSFFN